jgi:hypothetical protein
VVTNGRSNQIQLTTIVSAWNVCCAASIVLQSNSVARQWEASARISSCLRSVGSTYQPQRGKLSPTGHSTFFAFCPLEFQDCLMSRVASVSHVSAFLYRTSCNNVCFNTSYLSPWRYTSSTNHVKMSSVLTHCHEEFLTVSNVRISTFQWFGCAFNSFAILFFYEYVNWELD